MNKTTYICQLPQATQDNILNDVENFHFCNGGYILTEEDKEAVLNSRLCDLEEVVEIDKYL